MRKLLAIAVGNSRTAVGRFLGDRIETSEHLEHGDIAALARAIEQQWKALEDDDAWVIMASVNDPVADPLEREMDGLIGAEIHRVRRDLPIPIGTCVDDDTKVGDDRLLAASAAWDALRQAVVVVDAGTAITVDFVDGQGTFHGGAIAPGAGLQLRALHEHTAALPRVALAQPDATEIFGRNTGAAMLLGVVEGARGMLQRLVERYAEHYGAFPMVVATGGDAETLFSGNELVDRIVPELVLMGIAVAARHAAEDEDPAETAEGEDRS
jgi:type III pantothenate kinase